MTILRLAVLFLLSLAQPVLAQPNHGLIENRTGLPLTLPLQIKTDSGLDVYLVLRTADSGQIAVTAYIEGGRFFRLLMPPGTYTLHAAMGEEWQGEDTLFGPDTEVVDLPEALTFSAGVARKKGHLIDLTAPDRMARAVSDIALCQTFAARQDPAPEPPRGVVTADIAPEVPFGFPLPPGPRDPLLDGRPELGQQFGNIVADIPLAQRLGEGPPRAAPLTPDRKGGARIRERLCDPA
ncbi:hypothetical protein [Palleronia abyssalis]|uniref:DUF4384 domain-containing protein n=1 Tax=Palleronia abyssalis TaxID=1501240 RepID=A0A2R8BTZ3_9RHOB|nr:hypothetical protein [Palleronia abyssalis]SPJ23605.1 hypothetical protein PAA8504_01418 [Palleronia abyssalis]